MRVVSVLSCITVFCTTYALMLPAITMETETYCGYTEHTEHTESCYSTVKVCGYGEETDCIGDSVLICDIEEGTVSEPELICGQEEYTHEHTDDCYETVSEFVCALDEHTHDESCSDENGELICELSEHTHGGDCYQETSVLTCEETGHTHDTSCYSEPSAEGHVHSDDCYHVHTEDCFEKTLTCDLPIHEHGLQCYSNSALTESRSHWEQSMGGVELTGVWADDLIAIAQSQLGYRESTDNYEAQDDGSTKGYTRYGDWYGCPYGDWCAMFVSFCLNYADIPQSYIPYEASCPRWVQLLSGSGWELYRDAGDYTPTKGDLIFFDYDGNYSADHVGIVAAVNDDDGTVKTIEGNSGNSVTTHTYYKYDSSVMGYGILPMNPDTVMTLTTDSSSDSILVVAGSDFQDPKTSYSTSYDFAGNGDYTVQTARIKSILNNIKDEYGTAYGFLAGGDYCYDLTNSSSTKTKAGINSVKSAVTDIFGADINTLFIQGNHDYASSTIAKSGANDTDYYGVFVLNEDDYSYEGGNESTVSSLASQLDSYLAAKVSSGYDKPVFITSHVPLHFSARTVEDGDGKYADTLFSVITKYGSDLNIIFLYGHNHAYGDDDYLGGSAQFLTHGDKISIAKHGSTSQYTEETLNFTYMNYGYTGYYWTSGHPSSTSAIQYNGSADSTLTMTAFVIDGNSVTVSRWDESGIHVLKHAGAAIQYNNRNMNEVCTVTTNSVSSPYTVTLQSDDTDDDDDDDDPVDGDSETLYTVSGGSGILSSWEKLESATEVTSGDTYDALTARMSCPDFTLYDICKQSDAEVPAAGVQVYLPVDGEMRVFGYEAGNVVWYDAELVELAGQKYMRFTATHFSYYGTASELSYFEFTESSAAQLPTAARPTKVTSVSDGDTVIIQSNLNSKYLNKTISSNRMTLTTLINATVWTVEADGSAFKLKDSNGQYLTLNNGTAGLTGTKSDAAVISFGSDGNAVISRTVNSTAYYLNDYQNGGQTASGWNENNAGSKCSVYTLSEYWVRCTSADDFAVGNTYMIVYNDANALGINGTKYSSTATVTQKTVEGETLYIINSDDNYRWQFSSIANGTYQLQNMRDTAKYLNLNSSTIIGSPASDNTITSGSSSGTWRISYGNYKLRYSGSNSDMQRSTYSSAYDMYIYKLYEPAADQLAVECQVTNYSRKITSDTLFTYRVTSSPAGSSAATDITGTYTVYGSGNAVVSQNNPITDGLITLKPGQTAVITVSDADRFYYVTEILPTANSYIENVIAAANGTDTTVTETTEGDNTLYTVLAQFTGTDAKHAVVTMVSEPAQLEDNLRITVQVSGTNENIPDNTEYTISVSDENGAAAYTSYRILDANGDAVGESVLFDEAAPSIPLKKGETAVIKGLAFGTYTIEQSFAGAGDEVLRVSAEVDGEAAETTVDGTTAALTVSYTEDSAVTFTNVVEEINVTFDFRDGTRQTVTTGDDGTIPGTWPVKSRYGKTFEYWSTVRDDESTEVKESDSPVFTGNTTLYAHWSDTQTGIKSQADASLKKLLRESTAYTDDYNPENLFDIDLEATLPTSSIETLILVFDLSSSMDNQCMYCGLKHGPTGADCSSGQTVTYTGYDGINVTQTACNNFVQRLSTVQNEATEFITELKGKLGDSNHCHVSIVGFNVGGFVLLDDVDLGTDAGEAAIVSTIGSLNKYTEQNTALSSGMYQGYLRLNALNEAYDVDPSNSCVLLLSDGVPTSIYPDYATKYTDSSTFYSIGTSPNTVTSSFYVGPDAVANATSSAFISRWQSIWDDYAHYGWVNDSQFTNSTNNGVTGPKFSRYQVMAPAYIAEQIRGTGASLYTISLGQNMDKNTYTSGTSYRYVSGIGLNNYDYLSSFSDAAAFVNNAESLKSFYDDLIEAFTTVIPSASVTDPMSENVDFAGFTAATNGTSTGITLSADGNTVYDGTTVLASYDADTRTITWDPTDDGTLSYKVRLKNEQSGFEDWDASSNTADYLTNGVTSITYNRIEGGTETGPYTKTVDVPYVHGWLGELTFTKVGGFAPNNAKALSGVTFTLHHDPANCAICSENGWVGDDAVEIEDFTAISDASGQVTFTGVPSGHNYRFNEDVPVGYSDGGSSYKVNISYGETSVVDLSGSGYWDDENSTLFNPIESGEEFPATGGSGTRMFTLGGLLFIAGAIVYGYILRRRNERRAE